MKIARLGLILALAAPLLAAQAIPARPEQLAFRPLAFTPPLAAAHQARLANGMAAFLHPDPAGVPLVRIAVQFRGGAYLDPRGKEGLAALFGQVLRSGGTRAMPAEDLDRRLDFLGATLWSYSGPTSGELALEVLEKDLPEGLAMFLDVLSRPAFRQDRLDLALKGARRAMERRNDDADSIAAYQSAFLLNGEGHFTTAFSTKRSLDAITRADLEAFHGRLLHPGNLVVTVTGRFERASMLARLDRTLGALRPGPAALPSPPVPAPGPARKPGVYIVDKDLPQSLVQLALPGLRRLDPDWPAALVMNQVLGGGGFTARLTKKIRSDEGLTYGIYAGFDEGAHWKGDWTCSFQTRNAAVPYALRLTLAELERMRREEVPAAELRTIKDALIQSFPAQWSDPQAVVRFFAEETLKGWPLDYFQDFRARIEAVTAGDVQRAARTYLNLDQLVVLVVGKAAEAEAGEARDHPGLLKDVLPLPLTRLPLRNALTMEPGP